MIVICDDDAAAPDGRAETATQAAATLSVSAADLREMRRPTRVFGIVK